MAASTSHETHSTLQLQTHSGKQVELNAKQLSQWVQQQEIQQTKPGANTRKDFASSVTLGRFGLQNAEDVINFLKSPAGETVKSEIGAELALIANIEEERRIELQEQQLFQRRLLAFIFLSLIAYREAKAHAVYEQIIEQIDKRLHTPPPAERSSSKAQSSYEQTKKDILGAYQDEVKSFEKELELNEQDEQDLQKEWEEHQQQLAELESKYETYDAILNHLETEPFAQLEANLAIGAPAPLTEEQARAKDKALTQLEKELASLSTEIQQKAEKGQAFVVEGKDADAKKIMHEIDGLHFKQAFLLDLLEVSQGKKHVFDANGEEVNSLSKADFILQKDKKIVKHEGQYYLIKADQNIHALSPTEKHEAAKQFQQSRDEILNIKKIVKENKELERWHHDKKSETLKERGNEINEYNTLIKNQINQLQAGLAITQQKLDDPDLMDEPSSPALANKPSPTLKHPSPTLKRGDVQSVVPSFRKIIQFLRTNNNEKKITRDQLYQFNSALPPAHQYLINNTLTAIPVSAPIPHTTMIMMLRHLERFGIDATKPFTTKIVNPLERKLQYSNQQPEAKDLSNNKQPEPEHLTYDDEPKAQPSSSLNPFQMTPKKY